MIGKKPSKNTIPDCIENINVKECADILGKQNCKPYYMRHSVSSV